MNKLDEFTSILLEKFASELTDNVFMYLENDKELMHQYLLLISKNDLKYVNSGIAKAIKNKFKLDNKNNKNKLPKSKLIQSFEEFE